MLVLNSFSKFNIFLYSRGVNFASSWHNSFAESREFISKHLHMLHPTHSTVLDLCQRSYRDHKCIGEMIMVDFHKLRATGALDQHQMRNNITIELEKMEDYVKNNWYTNFINIFMDKQRFKNIPYQQLDSFYNSVTVLISNQVSCFILNIL
jgi:hypothetical protein